MPTDKHISLPSLLSILLVLPTLTLSQSCAPLTTNICDAIISAGTPVFVPPEMTIDTLQTYASRLVNLLNLGSDILEPCRSYVLQLICGTWFRPCYQPSPNVTLPIPQQPCLDTCWNWYNSCSIPGAFPTGVPLGDGFYFPGASSPPLNCGASPLDPGAWNSSFYQAGNALFPYAGTNYSVPCSLSAPIKIPEDINCQSPLVFTSDSTGLRTCAFTCPLPSLTDSQYNSAKDMQGILGWFSWVTTALLIITLVVNPRSRDFPRNLVIMTAAAANIAAGAIILPTYAGYDNTWCGGTALLIPQLQLVSADSYGLPEISFNIDESVLDFQSSLCTFQGAMLQFGFLAAVFWWTIIAFNMCLELYFGKMLSLEQTKWKWVRFGIYNFAGWGPAFVLMVIPAAAGRIKFAPAGTYCFVTGEDNYAWSLTFWFLPVGLSLLLGVTLFFLALVRMTILFITLRKVKKLLLLYVRLSIFIFLYLILFVFITAYNIQYATNNSNINDGYEAYYQCLLFGEPNCSLSDSIANYNLVMLKGFAISSLGVLLFCIFISWDVILFWYNLFKGFYVIARHRNKDNLVALFNMVAFTQGAQTITATSASMTITQLDQGEEEENAAEESENSNKEKSKDDGESEGVELSTSSEE